MSAQNVWLHWGNNHITPPPLYLCSVSEKLHYVILLISSISNEFSCELMFHKSWGVAIFNTFIIIIIFYFILHV